MGDTVLSDKEQAAPAGFPDWTQEAMDRATFQKGALTNAYGAASGSAPAIEPGFTGSGASWQQFFDPDASFKDQIKRSDILGAFDQDARDKGQNVILVTPNDVTADAPYDTRVPLQTSIMKTPDIKPPGLSPTDQFRQLAEENGIVMPPDDLASMARSLSSKPGAAFALSLDAANVKAVRDMDPDYLVTAPEDTCVITLPNDKGVLPVQYPNNLGIADGVGNYSNTAPIFDTNADGKPTGFDPKSDMLIYTGFHELDHCTNSEDSQANPFPEYDSDVHAGRKYAEAYGQELATDATVPYFVRSLRAESTVLDQQGVVDKYVLNGIAPLPGEGKPLPPSEQRVAAQEIKDFREDLYENAGISEEMMQDPDRLSENRYALYHETERMLRDGELDNTPHAKELAENFTDGAKRYQPDNYGVDSENVINKEPVLPAESYGMTDPVVVPPLPNFFSTPQQPASP